MSNRSSKRVRPRPIWVDPKKTPLLHGVDSLELRRPAVLDVEAVHDSARHSRVCRTLGRGSALGSVARFPASPTPDRRLRPDLVMIVVSAHGSILRGLRPWTLESGAQLGSAAILRGRMLVEGVEPATCRDSEQDGRRLKWRVRNCLRLGFRLGLGTEVGRHARLFAQIAAWC